MRRGVAAAGAAAFIWCGWTSTGFAAVIDVPESVDSGDERLLGSADEDAAYKALLPFTRQLSASSVVTGSLADSLAAAGVPAATSLEALHALDTAIDLQRDVRTGDHFYVRHEQTYTLAGNRIDVGRVLWLEVRTKARGTIAIHRFKPKGGTDQFWLASGQAAGLPMMRQPLNMMTVTSGFGLRADPLDHPSSGVTPAVVEVAVPPPPPPEDKGPSVEERRAANRAWAGFEMGSLGSARVDGTQNWDLDRVMAARRIRAREAEERRREEEAAAAAKANEPPPVKKEEPPAEPLVRKMFMHEGLDLLANSGTPVYAAADGTVTSVGPNGGYGNWIKLAHPGRLATIYGHLSGFAPGLQAGQPVLRGELIGFVGSTGRSTGAHLHFEIQTAGRPLDPAGHPALRCAQLAGSDLVQFKKQVAASLSERDRELARP